MTTTLKLDNFLPYRLSVLSNIVSVHVSQAYSVRFGLSRTQWRITAVLGEHGQLSAEQLSEHTQMEKSVISRAVKSMLERGLIKRSFDENDRRRSRIDLSKTGLSIYQEVIPAAIHHEKQICAAFNEKELNTFSTLIAKLDKHVRELG